MTDLVSNRARSFRHLSAAEALRALYVDFEGPKDQPPVLLGVHRRGRGARPWVHQVALDDAFSTLGIEVRSLSGAIEVVVRRAERGDRRIVAWSEYELGVVRTLSEEDPELVNRFEARYANARAVAERWRNRCHGGDKPSSGKLSDYLTLVGYRVPDDAHGGEVGDTVRLLQRAFERGRPATARELEHWRRLLEHNRHDCIGVRTVCLHAARQLDAQTT